MKADLEGLAAAAAIVKKGGLICYPTDTVYGFGCDPLNATAVESALRAKGHRTRPMPVLVKTLEDAARIAFFTESARKLAGRFWPGPLTIVLKAKEVLPRNLIPDGTVGIRSPKHAVCLELLGLCSGLLVGTSANLSGKSPAITADQVVKELGNRVDLVLDGGRATLGVSSTVVDLTGQHLSVIREGPIGKADVLRSLKRQQPR